MSNAEKELQVLRDKVAKLNEVLDELTGDGLNQVAGGSVKNLPKAQSKRKVKSDKKWISYL